MRRTHREAWNYLLEYLRPDVALVQKVGFDYLTREQARSLLGTTSGGARRGGGVGGVVGAARSVARADAWGPCCGGAGGAVAGPSGELQRGGRGAD